MQPLTPSEANSTPASRASSSSRRSGFKVPQSALTLARQVNNNIELQEQNKVLSAELVALRESMSKLQIAYATPHSRPPSSSHKSGGRQQHLIRCFWHSSKKPQQRCSRLGPVLASPSTLNTPFHTLNYTAFAIAIAADNNVPEEARLRAI